MSQKKSKNKKKNSKKRKARDYEHLSHILRQGAGYGPNHNRDYDVKKGRSRKQKHKGQELE